MGPVNQRLFVPSYLVYAARRALSEGLKRQVKIIIMLSRVGVLYLWVPKSGLRRTFGVYLNIAEPILDTMVNKYDLDTNYLVLIARYLY